MHRRRTAAVAVAATAVLLAGAGGAAADGVPPATATAAANPDATDAGDGAWALCRRAPRIEWRIERALSRLDGTADVPGSIARLEQRVAAANAAGHTQIAAYLGDRLAFRRSLVPTLQKGKADLSAVESWCAANDAGTGS